VTAAGNQPARQAPAGESEEISWRNSSGETSWRHGDSEEIVGSV